jgi:hypothetical protein
MKSPSLLMHIAESRRCDKSGMNTQPNSGEHLGSYLAGWGDWQSGPFFSQH